MNIDEIKMAFPNPVIARSMSDQREAVGKEYCVGGALCRSMGEPFQQYDFPASSTLTDALLGANPALPPMIAMDTARHIVRTNDKADFERAWHLLQTALEYTE